MRARVISGLPADLVGSLTGLTQGHFPVHARARYADDLAERDLRRLGKKVRREPQRGQDRQLERPPPLDQHLRAARRSGDRHQRRRHQEDRREQEARSLHHPAGRLRQPLHVRAPRQGLEALPGAEELRRPARPRRVPRRPRAAAGGPAQADARRRAPAASARRQRPRPRRLRAGLRRRAPPTGVAAAGRAREGAPVRRPEPPGQPRDRRGDRAAARRGRLRGLQGLLLQGPEAQAV